LVDSRAYDIQEECHTKASIRPIRIVDEQVYLSSIGNDAYYEGDSDYTIIQHVVERIERNDRHISLLPFLILFLYLVDIDCIKYSEQDEHHDDDEVNEVVHPNTYTHKQQLDRHCNDTFCFSFD
jgi:hypothetical protein